MALLQARHQIQHHCLQNHHPRYYYLTLAPKTLRFYLYYHLYRRHYLQSRIRNDIRILYNSLEMDCTHDQLLSLFSI